MTRYKGTKAGRLRSRLSPYVLPSAFILALLGSPALAGVNTGNRAALILGNQQYRVSPLANPLNDARVMAISLRELGFNVLAIENGDLNALRDGVRRSRTHFASDGVALFYYAGHAVQYHGVNYLVPVDFTEAQARAFPDPDGMLSLDEVLRAMDESGAGLRILVLDACRDFPFGSTSAVRGEGLATLDAEGETFVAYSTAAGRVAEDGVGGPNSPFTAALITALEEPDLDLSEVFRLVRRNVREATQGRQVPWTSGSIETRFVFREAKRQDPVPAAGKDVASVHWATIRNSIEPSDFAEFIRVHQGEPLAEDARSALDRLRAEGRAPSAAPVTAAPQMPGLPSDLGVTPCDMWASSPIDPRRVAPSVPRGLVNIRQAIRSCAVAVAEDPANPRLLYQLGRSLTFAGRFEEARGFYEQAEALGYGAASNSLGAAYRRGRGAERDPRRALQHFARAAAQGVPAARLELATIFSSGDGIPASAPLSLHWLQLAAGDGFPPAIDLLANTYRTGFGVTADPERAARLYEVGAALGNANSMSNLGTIYIAGEGVPRDPARGVAWYERATDAGSAFAPYQLARLYRTGVHRTKDPARALELLQLSLERGYEWAPFQIGDLYARGDLGNPELAQAYRYFWIAQRVGRFRQENQSGPGATKLAEEAGQRLDALEQQIGAEAASVAANDAERWLEENDLAFWFAPGADASSGP